MLLSDDRFSIRCFAENGGRIYSGRFRLIIGEVEAKA